MDIIGLAFRLVAKVEAFAQRARRLYYAVMLMGHRCPWCGGGLSMVGEGKCQCRACRNEFDATLAFQRCAACGGEPVLQVRRYRCQACGRDIVSRFHFDGLVFDTAYFREKMAEARRRRKDLRDRVREMLAASRSQILLPEACDLGAVPGLAEALDSMVAAGSRSMRWAPGEAFDLGRYQSHVLDHIGPFALSMAEIPPLTESARKDRIWRFIAIIFMAHAGLIRVWQEGQSIMVMQHETDREGQDVPGDLEAADGLEGSLGRVEA
ncbi:MAG: hypothetical protein WBF96_12140 [Phycisphaerae bacterium]